MTDSSPTPLPRNETPLKQKGTAPNPERKTSLLVSLVSGLFKLAAVALVVYMTYFFTMMFARRTPPPPPLSDEQAALAKKGEDLRAQGKKVLSSYGWVDPVTKSKVRIPIDRAMELIVAENVRPPAPPAAVPVPVPGQAAPAAKPGTTPTPAGTQTAIVPAPPPTPTVAAAPAGFSPEQLYRMVCITCHDTDGKGKIVKLAMPTIPDLTDPKWQTSRTDAELTHSILEGKESTINGVKVPLMLPMKDKLALAHADVKDMVAFMRGFKGGKQTVPLVPTGPAAEVPPELAQALAVPSPVVPASPAPVTPAPSGTQLSSAATGPAPAATSAGATPTPGSPQPSPGQPTQPSAPNTVAATLLQPAQRPPTSATSITPALPPALPVATVDTAARAERLRVAGNTFNTLCIVCHGADGRGSLVRVAMPPIPDFTSRDWQSSRTSSQLATSILEGKGTLMIPWNTRLTPEQARDLVLYVRNFGGPEVLAAETEREAPSAPSLVEFDNKIRTLRQQFDELERQLQALPPAPTR
jgi:mono/diheme cytochrome c family protein